MTVWIFGGAQLLSSAIDSETRIKAAHRRVTGFSSAQRSASAAARSAVRCMVKPICPVKLYEALVSSYRCFRNDTQFPSQFTTTPNR
jgi:hypothetical protein